MTINKFVCPYNGMIDCYVKTCKSCGWNPEVAEKRLEKLRGKKEAENDASEA